nr:cadmium/zinc-transporting ATPase [Nitraria sibirica]
MGGEEGKGSGGERKKLQKSYFDVLGICCPTEVPLIENILNSLDGVEQVSVVVPTRTVIVLHDTLIVSQLDIVKALNQARLEANVKGYEEGSREYRKKWPSPYAIVCGVMLLISLLKYFYSPLRWFAIAAVAVGIFPILLKCLASLRNFRIDITFLMLVAVGGSIAMKDYIEAGTIVFLFSTAEWLQSRASHKANAVMSSLMSIAPQRAIIAETGEEVDANDVKLNTIIAVKAGADFPIDGIVIDGKCEVDEKALTGESFPVPKQKDSIVWAGTMNLNGYITVKTTALAEDCVVAKMAKLVEDAQNSKSKTHRFIDRWALYYTPVVIVISVGVAVIPVALGVGNRNHWFHLALVVLVSACPCALILSTPVVTFCALTKAATSGLLIKGGDYLEILAKVKVVAFDKTGTITRGEFIVSDFQSLCKDIEFKALLSWVSSIESKSSHPMANALVDFGKSLSIEPKPEDVEDYQNFPGEGIYGKLDGKEIYIGNKKIALRAGCGTVPTAEGINLKGKTIGYVYCGGSLVGVFSLSDTCRTGAAEALRELKLLGIKTAMLTGDNQAAAMEAQQQLGDAIGKVHAELLPEDKAKIINQFKEEGPTAMVGDGINDAPALATADIGISMGISGSALATETGHVILMSNDMRKIPKCIKLARKSHRKVTENIVLSILTKAAILALAICGHPLVWAAVLADVGTCLLVILNSMLILHRQGGESSKSLGSHKHGKNCCKSSASPNIKKHGGNCCKSSALEKIEKGCCSSSALSMTKNLEGKCRKPSVGTHMHNLRCNTYNTNTSYKRCCSEVKSQNECEPKTCTSVECDSNSTCEKIQGIDAAETNCCGHGRCNPVDHDIEAQNNHAHGCLGKEDTCHEHVEQHNECVEGEGCCADGNHNESKCCTALEEDRDGHCCGKEDEGNHNNSIKECGQIVEHGCRHEHREAVTDQVSKCCKGHSEPPKVEYVRRSHCRMEKREIGGCCRSYYMEEACNKHAHLGGLTEIITE